jgi:hypothetical protein
MPFQPSSRTPRSLSAGELRRCAACASHDVPVHRRKYCDDCGDTATASTLRKREIRRLQAREYRRAYSQDPKTLPPYLNGWPSREAYNAYWAEKVGAWRRRKREKAAIRCSTDFAVRDATPQSS